MGKAKRLRREAKIRGWEEAEKKQNFKNIKVAPLSGRPVVMSPNHLKILSRFLSLMEKGK